MFMPTTELTVDRPGGRSRLNSERNQVVGPASAALSRLGEVVREKPGAALAIALGVGLAIGWWAKR